MYLRVLELVDMEKIRQERNDLPPGILRTPYLLTEEMQLGWYYQEVTNRDSRTRYWAIEASEWLEEVRIEVEEMVGYGGIENIEWENRCGELSIMLFSKYHKKGYGKEAVEMFLHEAFNHLGLETVYAEVYECNPNLGFWEKLATPRAYLPRRKLLNGIYYGSHYYVFGREDI